MIPSPRIAQLGYTDTTLLLEKQISFICQFKNIDNTSALIEFLAKHLGRDYPTLTVEDFLQIISNGITGKYGDVMKIEPQTFYKWIRHWQNDQQRSVDYLTTALLPTSWPARANEDWFKEANKCYNAFLRGISHENFHHAVYDRLMCDGFIANNSYLMFYDKNFDYLDSKDRTTNEISQEKQFQAVCRAKREVLRRFFAHLKAVGRNYVYFIKSETAA